MSQHISGKPGGRDRDGGARWSSVYTYKSNEMDSLLGPVHDSGGQIIT